MVYLEGLLGPILFIYINDFKLTQNNTDLILYASSTGTNKWLGKREYVVWMQKKTKNMIFSGQHNFTLSNSLLNVKWLNLWKISSTYVCCSYW